MASPDLTRDPTAPRWGLARRVGFRFLVAYVVLYAPRLVQPLPWWGTAYPSTIVASSSAQTPYRRVWTAVVQVTARTFGYGGAIDARVTGSGDRLYNWMHVATVALLAALIALVWSILDRRRLHYRTLAAWLRVGLRGFLAVTLIAYGLDKVFPNQFEPLNPVRLAEFFGEASPAGLAWAFLGLSTPYVIFAGAGEVLAGTLLLFQRTTSFGALVGLAVMSNVLALNLAFDIPVKLFSAHLVLFLIGVLWFDADRLVRVLVRNRPTDARLREPLGLPKRWERRAAALAWTIVLAIVALDGRRELWLLRHGGRMTRPPAIAGIFDVERFSEDGVVRAPLLTDSSYWRRVAIDGRRATVRTATDSLQRFSAVVDGVNDSIRLSDARGTALTLAYRIIDSGHVVLMGRNGPHLLRVELRRIDILRYPLASGSFHWRIEAPDFR